eukprot:GHVS01032594.1.p2 GENE.GHVS01032594.1~~GHVS01032594.1.p2  ORF type:complete len:303 (+),score=10.92 GHVS01032594.1:962-1870(+)
MQTVSLDFVGPRTYSGVDYHYAVFVDHGSRFATTAAIAGAPSSATASRLLLTSWIAMFGAPTTLITDRGAYFDDRWRRFVCEELGIKWIKTSVGYPQGNGINESLHRTLEKSIAVRVQGREDLPFWKQKVFGIEACLPGGQAFHGMQGEEARRQSQAEIRIKEVVRNVIETQRELTLVPASRVKVGDTIVHYLSEQQWRRQAILTGYHQYTSQWSLPCRVLEIRDRALKVQELHNRRPSAVRIVPLRMCRGFTSHMEPPRGIGQEAGDDTTMDEEGVGLVEEEETEVNMVPCLTLDTSAVNL